ncbi:protein neprosin-like [Lolium perenne]|uniref:protein neprosin-like n=1 Tax=Lolium perenne TaxID=4522 RepID=UPI0021F5E98E|nr:uncharacterized protein LOC127338899 [Lolium perenne]
MKEIHAIRVTILLSYLVLVTRGKDFGTIGPWENTSKILIDRQVNKTIVMEDGDVYDCIDANHQPAFDHPLLKNHKIQMEPSSFPIGLNIKPSSLHVDAQVNLSIIDCPAGMIPILRNSKLGQIIVHNIDQVFKPNTQHQEAGIKYFDDLYGVRATINVYEPKVYKDSADLSQTGIQIDNGPKDQIDSIVVCYSVAPSFAGDTFARFHVSWTDGALKKSCVDHNCPGFVQVSQNVGIGGRVLPISVYNGPQYVINILVFKDPKTNNWWLAYGEENTPIGYWPSSLFTRIKDKGDFSFWGGHVAGPTASINSPQIGSGHFASEGYGKAAFMKNIQIVDEKNKLVTPNRDKDLFGTSDLTKYTVDGYGVNKYGMHMYYGGPGVIV